MTSNNSDHDGNGEGDTTEYASRSLLPLADPLDIVLANEKDLFHVRELTKQCIDIVDGILGSHATAILKSEIKLFTGLAYYGLTTLRGAKTLGEEACDLTPVTPFFAHTIPLSSSSSASASGASPAVAAATAVTDKVKQKGTTIIGFLPVPVEQRILLLILSVILPYLVNRIQSGGWKPLMKIFYRETAQDRANALRARLQQQQQHQQAEEPNYHIEKLKEIGTFVLTTSSSFWILFQRFHLASFYFGEPFHTIPKRIADVWYVLSRKPSGERQSYAVLGFIIYLQLSIIVLSAARKYIVNVSKILISMSQYLANKLLSGSESNENVTQSTTNADEREEATQNQDTYDANSMVPSLGPNQEAEYSGYNSAKCGICLSQMTNPACPPCGHLYCYQCIQEAVFTSSQCPHCRQETTPQSILCIYTPYR